MNELKIVAVGSSLLIADEIKSITLNLLGNSIPIDIIETRDVRNAVNDTFYVCAATQEEYLRQTIPGAQLYVFDLHPTTKFFLDIAKIPAGQKVYVFNNLLPYTQLLAEECRQLGINHLKFQAIAYDEMIEEEIQNELREAKYIIGVDCLVGDKMLFSDKYRQFLRDDVQIIAGKRAASVQSASKLLAAIAKFYYETFSLTRKIKTDATSSISHIIQMLKSASSQALTSQVGVVNSKLQPSDDSIDKNLSLDEQLIMLEYLQNKFLQLST